MKGPWLAKILEIASQISTAIALAGLTAAIFFLVLRQILAKDIFPTLIDRRVSNLRRSHSGSPGFDFDETDEPRVLGSPTFRESA